MELRGDKKFKVMTSQRRTQVQRRMQKGHSRFKYMAAHGISPD